jgi:hypothetical protein
MSFQRVITIWSASQDKVTGNKNDGITVRKGGQVIKFDIRVETPKEVLWCAYIMRPEPDGKIAAGVSNGNPAKQTFSSMQERLPPTIKMNIERAHAIWGHFGEDIIKWTAAALNMLIMRGMLKSCKPCAIAKAKQKNLNNKSEGAKADRFNGWVYHDIVSVKESNEDKKLGCKKVWHIFAEETVNFKQGIFFVSNSEPSSDMCAFMQHKKARGHPVAIIWQDNAGKNKQLITLAHSKDWKHGTTFENTARKTPQKKSYAELVVVVIAT